MKEKFQWLDEITYRNPVSAQSETNTGNPKVVWDVPYHHVPENAEGHNPSDVGCE